MHPPKPAPQDWAWPVLPAAVVAGAWLFIQLPDQRIPLAVVLLALAFIGVKLAPASAMVQFVGLVVLGIGMAALAIDLGRSAPGTRRWWFGTVGLVVAGLPLGMAASLWVARHDIKAQV